MRATILLVTLMLLVKFQACSQVVTWSFPNSLEGDINLYSMHSMCQNSSSVIIAGTFQTLASLDGQVITNQDGEGIFIARYFKNGNISSINKLGVGFGLPLNHVINIAQDENGGFYLGVQFKDSLVLGNNKFYSRGVSDFVIARYTSNCSLLWAKHIGSVELDGISSSAGSMYIDSAKNLILTGLLTGSQNIDSFYFVSTSVDMFLLKLDTLGTVKLLKKCGSENVWDLGVEVRMDLQDNMLCLMSLSCVNSNFIDGIQIFAFNEYISSNVGLIAKWNSAGQIQWVRHFGGATFGAEFGVTSIKCDSKGNVYVAGSYFCQSSLDQIKIQGGGLFNAYGQDVFIIKYDKDGNFKWFKHTGYTDEEEWRGFDISENDEIYLAYIYHTKSKFETDSVLSKGGNDIALVKLDTSGNVVWVNNIGGQVMNKLLV